MNPETGETQDQFARRTRWWRVARFGMFIHWGLYAVPAGYYHGQPVGGIGEWIMNSARIPIPEYEQFARQFNPTGFDAKAWVRLAKDAGMKYIVITSKHHDGFCMFGTKLTDYNIVDATPYGRDPLKMLADECKRRGIRLCFYYSVMDWHHPDYLPRREWDPRPASSADFSRYLAYMKGQLKELLTRYGDIGVIWFDGGWEGDAEKNHSLEVVKMIRSIKPGILINDRINLPEDFSTPEQTIPAGALPNGRLWETCMTLNDTWGYKRDDHNWKSATDLTRKLIDIASKGGNFLLNVGPMANGRIPQESVDRLEQVGRWMKRNGASIYGTRKSPYRRHPFDGRCTVKGDTLYVHAFSWPEDGLRLAGLKTPVRSASLLDGGEPVRFHTDGTGPDSALVLERPHRLDPFATVVALRLAGPPAVEESATVVRPGSDGALALRAPDGDADGQTIRLQGEGDDANFGYWTDAADSVVWRAQVARAGTYEVRVSYACAPDTPGAAYAVDIGDVEAKGTVESTGGWGEFRTVTLGQVSLPAGAAIVRVRALSKPGYAVMNLRDVRLIPGR